MCRLSLEFSRNGDGKTYLENQYASYPFHICRTQYIEDDPLGMANIYIQSASGGIYENESLTTNIIANSRSYSHITTQASTLVHGMTNGEAQQTVNINAIEHAYTEYVSDPLILFPASKLNSKINIYSDETSTAIIADAFLLHFLNGEDHIFNQFNNYLNIYTDGNELLAKDIYIVNQKNFLNIKSKYISMGTISIINRSTIKKDLLKTLQVSIQANNDIYGGATLLPNECGIIIKFLATDGDTLKKAILNSWIQIRESIVGIKPKTRRK